MIISPTRDESGAFQCQLINEAGAGGAKISRDFIAGPETKSHRLNDAAELDCPAQGNPEPRITWIKNGIRLSVDDPRYQFLENGRRLRISPSLTLTTRPRGDATINSSRTGTRSNRRRRGHPAPVRFQSLPTPITVWKKDGRQVASDGRVQVRPETLIISRANDSDAGVYTCEVRNNIGSDMIRIEVVVQTEDQRPALPDCSGKIKLSNRAGLLSDRRSETNHSVEEGTMPIEESANYRFNLERQRLLITNLEASHAGLYTCEAQILLEWPLPSFSSRLWIREVPSVVKQAFANQDVTLECQATGDPVPLITWQKNGAEIPRNDPYYRTLDSGNLPHTLRQNNRLRDFPLRRQNDAGSDTQLRMLEILGELSLA
uniref:Ig-like domain-containing protein n=1 Tax=Macrostomum lignano TaxID=282301 RepID=A0A1I8H6D1_9PLAT